MAMLFRVVLHHAEVFLVVTKGGQFAVVFLAYGKKDGFEVADEGLSFTHFSQFGLFLFVSPDVLVRPSRGLLDIDAFLGNAELDEVVGI
jgi:hypothetical protein